MKALPSTCVALLAVILASVCEAGATANHVVLAATAQPSPAPTAPPPVELVKRQLIPVAINVCGWVDGDYTNSWYVRSTTNTCWFNSDVRVVASPFYTSCVPFADSTTSASRASVITCWSSQPYCQIVTFPSSYSIHYCGTEIGKVYNIELTYSQLGGSLLFPYFTGSQGISTGTQYGSGITPAFTSTSTTTTTSSTTPTPTQSPNPTPVGPIVGGVVGGIAVIGITAIVIIFIVKKRRKAPPPLPPPTQYPPPTQAPPTNEPYFAPSHYQPPPADPYLAQQQYQPPHSPVTSTYYGGAKPHNSVVYDPASPTVYSPTQSGAYQHQTRVHEAPS